MSGIAIGVGALNLASGEGPANISGIAIMMDTDNTGESTTAYYGDIRLLASE